ncbi:MAG: hypothetical protein ACTHMS_13275 [Jatrophihabitans sp.]|uniref:hypothetical protein n=1 Tax=Jatrophihabitans sp. TaxID=1932789 RepID=UPI003F806794
MVTPVISPYVPFYASTQPYITVAEFLAQPTGVDVSQLIPGANAAANAAALATQIRKASSYADSLCYQVLAATLDMQSGEYRVWRDGTIRVPLDNSPVVEISNVAVGYRAGQLSALTDLSGVWLDKKIARIPVAGTSIPYASGGGATAASGRVFAQVQYVNGYANTILAADAAQGDQSVTVSSALGVFPGMPLGVYDDNAATSEQIVVASTYTQGSTTVPLATPLQFAHASGTSVSALPQAIKLAVTALTSHLIKTRGAESIALSGVSGGPAEVEKTEPGATEEYEMAVDLLHPFRRVI